MENLKAHHYGASLFMTEGKDTYYKADVQVHPFSGGKHSNPIAKCYVDMAANVAMRVNAHDELVKALQEAMSIIDRLSEEYSTVAKHHSSFTNGEYKRLNTALKNATDTPIEKQPS